MSGFSGIHIGSLTHGSPFRPTMRPSSGAHAGSPYNTEPNQGIGSHLTAPGDPFDAAQQNTLTGLHTNELNTLGGLTNQENSGALDYGFTLTRGPDGEVSGYNTDPNNPFSRMAQLQRAYETAGRGTDTSYAAQGQLYSGALQNAQNANLYNKQSGESDLRKGFQALLDSIRQQRIGAVNDYTTGATNAGWAHLQALNGGTY